jgi:hypothetical protein
LRRGGMTQALLIAAQYLKNDVGTAEQSTFAG